MVLIISRAIIQGGRRGHAPDARNDARHDAGANGRLPVITDESAIQPHGHGRHARDEHGTRYERHADAYGYAS